VNGLRQRGLLVAMALGWSVQAHGGERVVFHATGAGDCAPAKILGSTAKGTWGTAKDTSLLAGQACAPHVLYFSLSDYERAMAGLGRSERDKAVLRRLEIVDKQPQSSIFEALVFSLAGLASTVGPQELGLVVDAAAILQGGEKRFLTLSPKTAVTELQASLARLMVELPAGPVAAAYAKEAEMLAQLAADVLNVKKASLPFAESQPVCFVGSASKEVAQAFMDRTLFPHKWRGGFVVALRASDREALSLKGRPRCPLYPGTRPYLRDLLELTDAQLERRFAAHLNGVTAQERTDFIVELAFAHATFSRLLTSPLDKARVPWLARWKDVLAADTAGLRVTLGDPSKLAEERKTRLTALRDDLDLARAILRPAPDCERERAAIARVIEMVARLSE
jgi:hypothetical protein